MSELKSQEAVMRMTIKVTRKDTGKEEHYELIGTPADTPKEQDHGRDAPDCSKG